MVRVYQVSFDGGAVNALASKRPSLQWAFEGYEKDWVQKRYEIKVVRNGTEETFATESSESINVPWPSTDLHSKELVTVSVRVAGADDSWSDWSEPTSMRVGVLDNAWSAPFVMQKDQEVTTHEEKKSAGIMFRSPVFELSGEVQSATIFATALGVYELELNGQKVASNVLAPGWTSYKHRLLHQVYDVTDLVADKNVIGGCVGAGWFSGWLGFDGGATNIYGKEKALSLELEVVYKNGTSQVVQTSDNWIATDQGPIISSQLYNGEIYDASREIPGWSTVDGDSSSWSPVQIVANPSKSIDPQTFGYSEVIEVIKPVELIITPKGKKVLDLGQNAVGVLHMKKVKGEKGHTVTLKHAEVMEDEELGVRPLREVKATDTYTFKGDAQGEEYTPKFTYHGCRYVQVDSYPGELTLDSFEFNVISTAMDVTGDFECSNPLLNRLHKNVIYSTRGNFLSIPTDCPQRDERMGWTGDIAAFSPTALYLFDSGSFLKNWLVDLRLEQEEKGGYPAVVVPDVCFAYDTFWNGAFCAIWQDASVIVPWRVFEANQDIQVLRDQYHSMKTWYEFIPKLPGKERWAEVRAQLGDWLDPSAPPDNPLLATTDAYLVADAFLFLIATQLLETAKLLEKAEDVAYFTERVSKIKKDYHDEYVTASGRLVCDTQTAYSLTICFGLYNNEDQLQYGGSRLANLCKKNGYKISTGFAGTPFVTEALVLTGHLDDAYGMLLTKECPSWLYPVSMGATTIWERWDSMTPNGKINPGDMTSFNHYALGAVDLWMHERIGGLKRGSTAYKDVVFKPMPGGGLEYAQTKHRSPYGWIESKWEKKGGKYEYTVKLPPNCRGSVELPNGEKFDIGSGVYVYEF